MKRKGLFAGSFDPITNGHLDIIRRASMLFDELIVLVHTNESKQYWFPLEIRREITESACALFENVFVDTTSLLTALYAKENNINFLVRGIRDEKDVNYEKELAVLNKEINPDIETVFFFAQDDLKHLSSSLVKEKIINKKDISLDVPNNVFHYLK